MNKISTDKEFKKTEIFAEFNKMPLGFVDIGSLGGAHSMINSVASLTDVLCFEPNKSECDKLNALYKSQKNFKGVTVLPVAVADKKTEKTPLYITIKCTNSSLLRPSPNFVQRYRADNFEIEKVDNVPTRSLDSIVFSAKFKKKRTAEFLKIDTQGTEHKILRGAVKTLKSRTLAILCEVDFMEIYSGQKQFSEVDGLLRNQGFCLYGLYPHYRSAKLLDRKVCKTEERLMWADALYFKDPLDNLNKKKNFSGRDIRALILIACVTHFYDFAMELAGKYIKNTQELQRTIAFIKRLAVADTAAFQKEIKGLGNVFKSDPQKAFYSMSKFVNQSRSNSDMDYVAP